MRGELVDFLLRLQRQHVLRERRLPRRFVLSRSRRGQRCARTGRVAGRVPDDRAHGGRGVHACAGVHVRLDMLFLCTQVLWHCRHMRLGDLRVGLDDPLAEQHRLSGLTPSHRLMCESYMQCSYCTVDGLVSASCASIADTYTWSVSIVPSVARADGG
jgi:hypothetical protein